MKPGIYFNYPIEAYHSGDGISKTGLCAFDYAPAVYAYQYFQKPQRKESSSFKIGSAVHSVMEGTFDEIYAIGPEVKSRAEKVWKDFEKANEGKIVLKPDEAKKVQTMGANLRSHRSIGKVLEDGGYYEASFYWIDHQTGILCKCRPDFISKDYSTIIDFKTAAEVLRRPFQAVAYRYHYYVSAAFTLEGVQACTKVMPTRYVFASVQSTPPHLVAGYEATEEELSHGREFFRRNLGGLERCFENCEWPGLPEHILPLGLPSWACKENDAENALDEDEKDDWWE
ncbi:MAG: hypothetical protein EOP04_04185 [Proteobacteria bacterium]|nr:MAG: hypothetical protein EOP04_04185 [Pseudomonadota bacterium]